MNQNGVLKDLDSCTSRAVAHYWKTRLAQRRKQEQTGKADQGRRSAVKGWAQMDGFIDLFSELVLRAGIPERIFIQEESRFPPGLLQAYQGMGPPGLREHIDCRY